MNVYTDRIEYGVIFLFDEIYCIMMYIRKSEGYIHEGDTPVREMKTL
jgi:hypothetical protein